MLGKPKHKVNDTVDMPLKDTKYTCANCDIYLACMPQTMAQIPLCCHPKYQEVNISCGRQFDKGIHRIWKRV